MVLSIGFHHFLCKELDTDWDGHRDGTAGEGVGVITYVETQVEAKENPLSGAG